MADNLSPRATIDDLYRVEGKAELIGGKIIRYAPMGHLPSRIVGRICRSLDDHCEAVGRGLAFTRSMGFAVSELSSGRESFSPDTSYYDGPLPADPMKFIANPPTFAAEVRSENDYGPAAEREIAEKRADYFEAGTEVVWDVDPEAESIRVYRRDRSDEPTLYVRGQVAEAEPAVPGWRIAVDDIFPKR